jgi:Family of unknown function (DUF5397)
MSRGGSLRGQHPSLAAKKFVIPTSGRDLQLSLGVRLERDFKTPEPARPRPVPGELTGSYNLHMALTHLNGQQPASIVGTWRRFGPVYQVIAEGDALPNGDRLMRVRVVETGEEVDYRLTKILDDPQET